MISPFDLPEIRSHLAPFLTSSDLLACAAVSKDWNSTYAPLLYHTCSALYYSLKNPTPSTLLKYATCIRNLRFSGIVSLELFASQCCNLEILTIDGNWVQSSKMLPEDFRLASSSITALIRQSPKLRHLQFLDQPALSSIELWEAIAECSNLSSLQFLRCSISTAHIPSFWKACSNLQTLEMQNIKLLEGNHGGMLEQPPNVRFPRLQVLTMTSISGFALLDQLEVIALAPILKSLDWNIPRNAELPSEEIRLCIQKQLWPSLQELSLYAHISDDDLNEVLDVMKEARRLYLPSARFGPKSFQSFIIHHSETIRDLNLYCCPSLTGAIIHVIMSSCPMLEVLAAPSLRGADLVRFIRGEEEEGSQEQDEATLEEVEEEIEVIGKDWVCMGLKSLTMYMDLTTDISITKPSTPTEKARFQKRQSLAQDHIFRQLARLVQLEVLNMARPAGCRQTKSLDLRVLERGGQLEKLSVLKRLYCINFHDTNQELGEAEINWMFDNWPRLSFVMGQLHPCSDTHEELQTMVYARKDLKKRKSGS
ncbi:hypothetical protein BGZ68_006995 [Mortierella alpina]|nr:hypothetical protein BGZ68_006995 [Mortierella alpina]